MGQGASGMPGAPGGPPNGPGGGKKDDKKKKKFEPRPPLRTGKKKRKKGPSAAVRTPQGMVWVMKSVEEKMYIRRQKLRFGPTCCLFSCP